MKAELNDASPERSHIHRSQAATEADAVDGSGEAVHSRHLQPTLCRLYTACPTHLAS